MLQSRNDTARMDSDRAVARWFVNVISGQTFRVAVEDEADGLAFCVDDRRAAVAAGVRARARQNSPAGTPTNTLGQDVSFAQLSVSKMNKA